MGVVLSTKKIELSRNEALDTESIAAWFNSIDRKNEEVFLLLSLEISGKGRRKKTSAKDELKALMPDVKIKLWRKRMESPEDVAEGDAEWQDGDYAFNFTMGQYFWGEKELYITPSEELFLYRWLVLNEDIVRLQKFYLYNMRKKFGKGFLKEYESKKESRGEEKENG